MFNLLSKIKAQPVKPQQMQIEQVLTDAEMEKAAGGDCDPLFGDTYTWTCPNAGESGPGICYWKYDGPDYIGEICY